MQPQLSFASHPVPSHQNGYLALLHPAGRYVEDAFLFFHTYTRNDHIRHCGLITGALANVDLTIKRRSQDLSQGMKQIPHSLCRACIPSPPPWRRQKAIGLEPSGHACMRVGVSACPEYSPHSGPVSKVPRHFSL